MAKTAGPTLWQQRVRATLVAGYLAVIVAGLTTPLAPRVFWTMLLPLLPLSIVLMGFPNWRRVCPLAFFGELGTRMPRATQRRVPAWFERWFFLVTFSVLMAMLALRLVATNGDGLWLAGSLVGLGLAAATINRIFTGKTWCNFFCPVGLVERIYTEPNSLAGVSNSQCVRCTACKKHCPDIDQENAYWRDLDGAARHIASYAFPGLVLGFYVYYWLRHGEWEAYFDGRWTHATADAWLALGPGFFFAPRVPALVAAPLSLVLFSAASYALFAFVERRVARVVPDAERRRHLMLALAAFVAFSTFYVFAGAPTLRQLPAGTRVMAFVAPLLATLVLLERWRRTREVFIQEKGVASLLSHWPFDEPPPTDAGEVYAWVKAGEHARERQIAAYEHTVRGILAEGLVTASELRLLEEIRKQLGISEREHDKVFVRLSEDERDLFAPDRVVRIEERVQLEGYRTALADALLRHAPASEVENLRLAFGVSREAHETLRQEMRGGSGALLGRAKGQLDRARAVRRDLEVIASMASSSATSFLSYVLLEEQDEAVKRVLEFLEIAGDADRVQVLRPRLFGGDASTRQTVMDQLAEACPDMAGLIAELEPLVLERTPLARGGVDSGGDTTHRSAMLDRLAQAADPYLRAGAVWVAGCDDTLTAPSRTDLCVRALDDPHPLVRETAEYVSRHTGPADAGAGFASLTAIEKMQFLRGVPLFADLDPEDLHDLALLAEEETYEPPRPLCEEGDAEANALFVLIDGTAMVEVRGTGDVPREVAVLAAGEVVGELSVLDESPRSATVRPKDGPVRVLRIPGHRFRRHLLHRARVAEPLLVTLAQRIRRSSRRLADAQDVSPR